MNKLVGYVKKSGFLQDGQTPWCNYLLKCTTTNSAEENLQGLDICEIKLQERVLCGSFKCRQEDIQPYLDSCIDLDFEPQYAVKNGSMTIVGVKFFKDGKPISIK